MNQALHILRKDLRHLWPELSAYGALLVLYGVLDPLTVTWTSSEILGPALKLLSILMPAMWLVLTARAVHDEALVGDNQFWVTRPYRWSSLLAAKILFIALCIILPFALLQMYLVHAVGLAAFADLGGLGNMLTIAAAHVWLLFLLAAVVTATLAQTFIAIVGVALTWIIVLTAVTSFAGPRMFAPYTVEICRALFAAAMFAVVAYQYRRRNTSRSRAAFAAIVIIFVLVYCSLAFFNQRAPFRWLTALRYKPDPTIRVTFDTSQTYFHSEEDHHGNGLIGATLPIHVEGLKPHERLYEVNASVHLTAPGLDYTSPWRAPSMNDDGLTLLLPKSIWSHFATTPVNMHLDMIATRLQPDKIVTGSTDQTFHDPDGGICRAQGLGWNCLWGYRHQYPAQVEEQTCTANGPPQNRIAMFVGVGGTSFDGFRSFTARPVYKPCPHSTIRQTSYRPAADIRASLDLPPIYLRDFRDR